jgi:hypothetical protein
MGGADSQKLLPWRGAYIPLRGAANLRLTAKSTVSEMFGNLDCAAMTLPARAVLRLTTDWVTSG